MGKVKKLCRFKVYDKKHIKAAGYNCPFRHRSYLWPGLVSNDFTLISDSMAKYVNKTKHLLVLAVPGLTIDTLTWDVRLEERTYCKNFKIIIVHLGTNNINDSVEDFLSKYEKLLAALKRRNPDTLIVVSAILPRPVDYRETKEKVSSINKALCKLAVEMQCEFLRPYRKFVVNGKPNINLYAKDLLHLNRDGTALLKMFFEHSIIRLKGKVHVSTK